MEVWVSEIKLRAGIKCGEISRDLPTAERALHMQRRATLDEKAHPETKHGGAPGKAGGGKKNESRQNGDSRFTKDTARKTGKSESSVQRDVARASKVEVLAEITGTSLDKGDEIDALAKLPAKEQRALAKAAARSRRSPCASYVLVPDFSGPFEMGGTMRQLADVVTAFAIGAAVLLGIGFAIYATSTALELITLR